jgi:hypothetical protein
LRLEFLSDVLFFQQMGAEAIVIGAIIGAVIATQAKSCNKDKKEFTAGEYWEGLIDYFLDFHFFD